MRVLPVVLLLLLVGCDSEGPLGPEHNEGGFVATTFFLSDAAGVEVATVSMPYLALEPGESTQGEFSLFAVGQDDVIEGTFEALCLPSEDGPFLRLDLAAETGVAYRLLGHCQEQPGEFEGSWVRIEDGDMTANGTYQRGTIIAN